MSIPLDQPKASGPPAIRFDAVGDFVVVGIVNVGDYQQRDFDTGDPLYWDDGGPRMGKVVTGLIVSSQGQVSVGKDHDPAVPGEQVSFWCEGGKWYTYRDAVAEANGIDVGDVMLWTRLADEPPKRAGMSPAKKYEAKLRKPNAKDGDLAERCTQLYHEAQNRPTLDRGPEPFHAPTPEPEF